MRRTAGAGPARRTRRERHVDRGRDRARWRATWRAARGCRGRSTTRRARCSAGGPTCSAAGRSAPTNTSCASIPPWAASRRRARCRGPHVRRGGRRGRGHRVRGRRLRRPQALDTDRSRGVPDGPRELVGAPALSLRYAAVAAIGGQLLIIGRIARRSARRTRSCASTRPAERVGRSAACPSRHACHGGRARLLRVRARRSRRLGGQSERGHRRDRSARAAGPFPSGRLPHPLSDAAAASWPTAVAGGQSSARRSPRCAVEPCPRPPLEPLGAPALARAARQGACRVAREAARERVRRRQIDAVGIAEEAVARARHAGVAVLPDDPVRARVDHDHAIVLVVVGEDVPVGQRQRERRLVECLRALGRVAPAQLARRS